MLRKIDSSPVNPSSFSTESNKYKECPSCAEDILVKARKCKHCGANANPITWHDIAEWSEFIVLVIAAGLYIIPMLAHTAIITITVFGTLVYGLLYKSSGWIYEVAWFRGGPALFLLVGVGKQAALVVEHFSANTANKAESALKETISQVLSVTFLPVCYAIYFHWRIAALKIERIEVCGVSLDADYARSLFEVSTILHPILFLLVAWILIFFYGKKKRIT